ncbi:DHA2 family efflux MFS transporter permease subunit [Pediococcus ethanolidurans]|uniref:DHA2 family efflux MFS transporter permease subunit n=1 Tax=Pediococcus ethanolidurans TaxID=319653 RepID=UPI0021E8810F|nr:DHA2 family efflux MFS transporter permease subunit [Pediococcus ethanolidurans]MCV3321473.1 DHA2 family efflux MFS transporter permease subunit [Pediococcus ethanolidurans]MCV3323447.1 DHA2 family efflux MFS transporter permease subunit [Pediococcus ethanolidurans]MCV3554842.1 DHA2 family efflux MFS transporter permease subunit [Pediococcus ethanolidurans]
MKNETNQRIRPQVIAAVIATGLMSFSGVIVETAMNITFPTLMKEFNVTTSIVQWLTTGYLLTVAIIVPLSSALKTRFRTKSLFIVANLLFLTGLIMDAVAPIFPILLLGRIVQGCGTGIALPLMFNIIIDQVPSSKIGMMMGIGTLITAVAPAIGPTFGGVVVASLGWRFVFIILVPLLLISLFTGIKTIEQKRPTRAIKFDPLSVLLIAATFIGFILGSSNMGATSFMSLAVAGAIVVGVIGLVGLIYRSLHIAQPVIDLRVLGNVAFAAHVFVFFALQLISLGMSFILPNYMQLVNGATSTTAGLVVLPGAALGAVMSPISGRIFDHFGAKKPLLTGSSIVFIGLVLFTGLALNVSNGLILTIYVFYMFGIGLIFGNVMTNGLSTLKNDQQADGNAILNTIQQFAGAVGTSIVSTIIGASQLSKRGNQADLTAIGSRHALLVLTILMAVAIVVLVYAINKAIKQKNIA